jgi:hypothetical protein
MARLAPIVPILLAVVSPVRAETVTITRETCAQLVQHVPDADVAYKPGGVDSTGAPVAPADLPGSPQITVPQEFSIPITVDLGQRLGFPADPNSFQSKAEIGVITYKDGQVFFNGQPLQDPDAAALSAACQKVMNRR